MKKKIPKISIVMATYNGQTYIREQLESILNQTYKDFMLIITDDNSADNTIDIIKEFKDKMEIEIVKNEENLGYNKNFQKAVSLAKTEYIAICDQDDSWHRDKLKILMDNIEKNTLIYANSHLIDENGKLLNTTLIDKLKHKSISNNSTFNSALPFVYSNCVSGHAVLFKKELVEYIIPFPTSIFFDAWIALNAASLNGIKYIDKELVYYRQHTKSVVKIQVANKKKNKITRIDKKKKLHLTLSENIQEILKSKILKDEERILLQKLKFEHDNFENGWINFKLFQLLNNNKEKLFAITPNNSFTIFRKFCFSKQSYKFFPFL